MYILGIESSCDDCSIAVVRDGREVLSQATASSVDEHKKFGGVVPEVASRQHVEAISAVCKKAVTDANIKYSDLSAIAVTAAPGLIGSLLCGLSFAKGLAYALKIPLIPVHHLRSHIAANYIATPDLSPPFMAFVVSGGHSHIIEVSDFTEFSVVGRAIDDAAGEAFDKVARVLGFPYPGGVALDKIYPEGNPEAFVFPNPKTERPFDFSFSGLKTAVINTVHNLEQKGGEIPTKDIASSFCHKICSILSDKAVAATLHYKKDRLVLAGGVSANSLLRAMLLEKCAENDIELFLPPISLCTDNGAMVAAQGYFELLGNSRGPLSQNAFANMDITDKFI